MTDWLMFDYGNVISCDQSNEDRTALVKAAGSVDEGAFWRAYWANRLDYDKGALTADEYWHRAAGPGANVSELRRIDIRSWLRFHPEMLELLDELGRDNRLALLSNAPWDIAGGLVASPLAARFEHLAFSCEFGAAKPDAACFEAALTRMGAIPSQVTFIDDRAENVAGAEALGIRGIRFTDPADLRAALSES